MRALERGLAFAAVNALRFIVNMAMVQVLRDGASCNKSWPGAWCTSPEMS